MGFPLSPTDYGLDYSFDFDNNLGANPSSLERSEIVFLWNCANISFLD